MTFNNFFSPKLLSTALVVTFFSTFNLYGVRSIAAANQIYPESFGAKADGLTDSTEAIRQAISASAQMTGPSEIIFSSGVYKINCTSPLNGVCFSLNWNILFCMVLERAA